MTRSTLALLVLVACGRESSTGWDRRAVCEAQLRSLELATRSENEQVSDLRARVLFGALDYYNATGCLGVESPVSTHDADACWSRAHDETCYLGIAKELLAAYRAHRPSW